MSNELNDKDPFAEDEKQDDENLITDGMVRKATYLIHKLADQKQQDFKEIQKKCKKLFAYTNLAKVPLEDGHKIIDKLIELTGGEEEKPSEGPRVTDDRTESKEISNATPKKEEEEKTEEDLVTATMRESIRAAVDITLKEVVKKEVPAQGLGGFVFEIGKVIFEAKIREEADK